MLTYSFTEIGSDTLYHHLYECIKNDIIKGTLKENDSLPSKRSFAKNLGISVITVENAYAQLMAEGYIYSVPKKGFFVEKLPDTMLAHREVPSIIDGQSVNKNSANKTATESIKKQFANQYTREESQNEKFVNKDSTKEKASAEETVIDFARNRNNPNNFPFSIWTKLSKEIMAQDVQRLMTPSPVNGIYALRSAICRHLLAFRGMKVDPSQIIIGAGTEYLYSLIIQLLGYDKVYAVENPGYKKIYHIYKSNHVTCRVIDMDRKGINMDQLAASDTDVLHITPAHHFPTGIVTPIGRRYEILSWAASSKDRYIIEDDFDSEFRMVGKSIPMLQSIDVQEKVIYMNTFSKSLSSTIRISYMVLPPHLASLFHEKLGFYSCTVSTFEQLTLAKFISEGYYERHINRMRTYYKNLQKSLTDTIKNGPYASKVKIAEEEAGLHFLLKLQTDLCDREIADRAGKAGYRILMLSDCYMEDAVPDTHTLVINYSGMDKEKLDIINEMLSRIL